MRYEIEDRVFTTFPGYKRAVVIAKDVDNTGEEKKLEDLLRSFEGEVRQDPLMEQYKEHPNIASWRNTFRAMELNPNKYPPSIASLIKRTRSGKDLPFINKLVSIFNVVSLKHITPCGGDDLDSVNGSLRLGFATGRESYVPLGKPEVTETPVEGEVIYFDTGDLDVFCRGWCWKNGDRSKITPLTRNVAINIEGMPPIEEGNLITIAGELAEMVQDYCGGSSEVHLLKESNPFFEIHL